MRIERQDELAILRMEAGKANAIDPDFVRRLDALIHEFDESDARALVLTGDGRFFCAGLNLEILSKLEPQPLHDFMIGFSELAMSFFECERPVVAAIEGHAIAGGCILAQLADRRLMAQGKGRIGVKEIALGVGLPIVGIETMRGRVADRAVREVFYDGGLFDANQALEKGLVDRAVAGEDLLAEAIAEARSLAAKPAKAFAHIKLSLRRPVIERIRFDLMRDTDMWLQTWFSPEAQGLIAQTLAQLGAKG